MARQQQATLPLGHVRNRGLFSNHWFDNRLRSEPEWEQLQGTIRETWDRILIIWQREKNRVERYQNEAPLEQAFIQPIFDALGWKLIYQTFLQGRKPDYALFLDDESKDASLAADRQTEEFWQHPKIVADAKSWDLPLNRPSRVNNQREFPPQQIEWYLDRSRLDFGILTNGKIWRLVPREFGTQQRRFQTYLECDLPGLLTEWENTNNLATQSKILEDFSEFFLFFSPYGFRSTNLRPLIVRAIEGSSEYRIGVGEGLKLRAFEALRLCIEGFFKYVPNELVPRVDIERVRLNSFILLYRLLFIMFAEDRGLLPYRRNNAYTANRSLGRYRDLIAGRLDNARSESADDFSMESTAIWDDLKNLFDLVDGGHRTYNVPQYNGGLFDGEAHLFLNDKGISDYYLARVIDQLGRANDPANLQAGLFRVDYRDLAIQHLGSIYEGLLELKPTYALEEMVVIARRHKGQLEERIVKATERAPKGWQLAEERYRSGTIYLVTQKGERRATGSYYTPDHIVNYIVDKTIEPVCQQVSIQLEQEIRAVQSQLVVANPSQRDALNEQLAKLQSDFDDRILKLKVLDPAMGSGHFLIRACQKLAEEIATHPYTGEEQVNQIQDGESSLSYWKRRVVEKCLYGVDLNHLAVELAKLALWLETVSGNEPLSFLDHHLRFGNSLIGGTINRLGALPGFEIRPEVFRNQVQSKIGDFLNLTNQIEELGSQTAQLVKQKDRLFRNLEQLREPFKQVNNLWCSAYSNDSQLSDDQFESSIERINRPVVFQRLAQEEWFKNAITLAEQEFIRPFAWEIEFPEIFFHQGERLTLGGFHVIIGNPPYDVLSELESGRNLQTFKNYIEDQSMLDPSRCGKNNLYKLFICCALELLRQGGYLGFITPMAVLGDEQASDLRRAMVGLGEFIAVEAFPQKDIPAKRVFFEAKLSTAIFVIRKGQISAQGATTFVSRVHQANLIDLDSPSLELSTPTIPLYDPNNFTVVSCSQIDWDLAIRIMSSGRLTRLGEFVEFFQGEVNESAENKKKRKNALVGKNEGGVLVTRGASICLYAVREASQGDDLFLNVDLFLEGKAEKARAFHHRYARVALQESCPQNNFRRIIACIIPQGEFCNHTVNYCPENKSKISLDLLLGLLNSKLADWYFTLGSTNAHVSHYQIYNLPFPVINFTTEPDNTILSDFKSLMRKKDFDQAFSTALQLIGDHPFDVTIAKVIEHCVQRIRAIELERGEISRIQRSALSEHAQPYQDLIDQMLFAMAGIDSTESRALEERLETML